ncbi:MAG TPA: signal transduction protein [Terriglobia bacterium]|nr:signal transduction protein [Terriglobia bacterium]
MKSFGTALLVIGLALPLAAQQAQDKGHRGGQRFEKLDTNKDGKISKDEWKGQANLFDRLDTNHDGFLTMDEMKQGRQAARQNWGQNLQNMDADHDGKISRQEWQGRAEMFDRLDADHDGFVTKDELQNRRGASKQR